MGRLARFETLELPKLLVIGRELSLNMEENAKNNRIPAFWDECFRDMAFAPLEVQRDYIYDPSYVGWMGNWVNGGGNFTYVVGMLMKEGADIPDGYACYSIESVTAAVGWIQGEDSADVCGNAHELTENALKARGFTNSRMTWCMELYNCPRFTDPDENGEITLDYYIPCDER